MKNAKKLLAVLIVVMMTLALAIPAFAGTITVNNAIDGETYKAYKIFDVTYTDSGDTYPHSYTILSTSNWYSIVSAYATAHPTELVLTQVGSTTTYNVTEGTGGLDAAAFAAYLIANVGSITEDGTATAANGSAELTGLTAGYYLVDSSVGALCALKTADDSFEFDEKNGVPEVEKTVEEDGAYADENDAKIGDTVNFKSEITIPVGTQNLVYHDTMDGGLTLNSASITVDSGSGTYTVITSGLTDGCTFEVSFTPAYLAGLTTEATVTIEYSAVLNTGAVVGGSGNENTATLKFGEDGDIESVPSTTTTYTWDFDVFKYTGSDEAVPGAGFTLYTDSACTTAVTLKNTSGTDYRVAVTGDTGTNTEIVTGATGIFSIKGLDSGTYYLKETTVPAGYNGLTDPVTVVISDDGSVTPNDATYGVKIENNVGTVLPATGGMGTVLFVTIGTVLFMAAGIVLTAKKRLYNEG